MQKWNNMQTLLTKEILDTTYRIQMFSFRSDNRTSRRYSGMCGHIIYTFKHCTQDETGW